MKTSEKKKHLDAALDEGLKESFPASDPVAISFLKPVEIACGGDLSAFAEYAGKKRASKTASRKGKVEQDVPRVDKGSSRQEIELKLEIAGKHVTQLIKRMPLRNYLIGRASKEVITSAYFDTPDFWLRRHGLSLRLRQSNSGWVQTLKTCDVPQAGMYRRGEWEGSVAEPAFDFIALRKMVGPHQGLKRLLRNELALNAIFTTRVTRTTWNLKLPTGDEIEFSLDQGTIERDDLSEPISEVELELKSGEPEHLFDCALQLVDAIPMQVGNLSKSARGYLLCTPPQSTEAIAAGTPNLRNRMTVEEGCKAIVADCALQIEGNSIALIQGACEEALHQMRVGLRRLRSALALFGRFASPPPGMEDELAWLEEKLGPARDWEVFSHSTLDIVEVPAPEDAGIAHLRHAAIDVASAKRKQAVSAVQSVRFTRLILTLARWLACVSWSSTVEKQWKHKLGGSLPRFAADCIAREQHRVRRCHKHLRNEEPILQHKFRIATKNLRYATEFFQSLYPNKELDDYLGSLAAMQDELGLSNDKMVAEGFLQQLAEEREDLRPSIGFARGFLIAKGNKVDSNLWKHLASMKPKMQK